MKEQAGKEDSPGREEGCAIYELTGMLTRMDGGHGPEQYEYKHKEHAAPYCLKLVEKERYYL